MPLPVVKQINALLWYLRGRHERRWLSREVEQWGRERAMGRRRYVRRTAVGWGLFLVLSRSAWEYLTEGYFPVALRLLMTPISLAIGWWIGASNWEDNERLYGLARRGGEADGPETG